MTNDNEDWHLVRRAAIDMCHFAGERAATAAGKGMVAGGQTAHLLQPSARPLLHDCSIRRYTMHGLETLLYLSYVHGLRTLFWDVPQPWVDAVVVDALMRWRGGRIECFLRANRDRRTSWTGELSPATLPFCPGAEYQMKIKVFSSDALWQMSCSLRAASFRGPFQESWL
jgi:hypothetical protein